jgi:hypothetical protein
MTNIPHTFSRDKKTNFMKLTDIKLKKLSLHLTLYGLTVLSRENKTGKSTIQEALPMVLPRGSGVR